MSRAKIYTIPAKVRRVLETDPWMKVCCYCGALGPQWHHPHTHAGRRIHDVWAIAPLCNRCHKIQNAFIVNAFTEYLTLARARVLYGPELEQLYIKYKNRDWKQELSRVAEIVKEHHDIIKPLERAKISMEKLAKKSPKIREW